MSLIIWSQCRKQILTWVGALVEWLWEETPVLKGVGSNDPRPIESKYPVFQL